MATRQELRQQIGEDLGIVPVGQDLESQDVLRIDNAINQAYAVLKSRNIAGFALDGAIPDEMMMYLALYIESQLLISYSVPESRYLRITQLAGLDGELALIALAGVTVNEYESTDDAVDY